jgi:hypothetical protein
VRDKLNEFVGLWMPVPKPNGARQRLDSTGLGYTLAPLDGRAAPACAFPNGKRLSTPAAQNVGGKAQDVGGNAQDVGGKAQDVGGKAQDVGVENEPTRPSCTGHPTG